MITADGRYVFFVSNAANLVTGSLMASQIFRWDRLNPTQGMVLVSSLDSTQSDQTSYASDGGINEYSITPDGRYVVFSSMSFALVTGTNDTQIYLKDLQNPAQPPIVVSSLDSTQSDQTGFDGSASSAQPQITPDGRYVVFCSAATNFAPMSGWIGDQIYVKDLQNPTQPPVIVSSLDSTQGSQDSYMGNDTSSLAQISTDGRYVFFTSGASNFATGSTDGLSQIYRKDMQNLAQAPILVSSLDPTQSDQTNYRAIGGGATLTQITGDGRYLLFIANAPNLVGGVSGLQACLMDLSGI